MVRGLHVRVQSWELLGRSSREVFMFGDMNWIDEDQGLCPLPKGWCGPHPSLLRCWANNLHASMHASQATTCMSPADFSSTTLIYLDSMLQCSVAR